MKVTNHRFPDEVVTLEGPQTSLWIRVNGFVGLYGCEGKETRCSFVRMHTSQDNDETSILEKR